LLDLGGNGEKKPMRTFVLLGNFLQDNASGRNKDYFTYTNQHVTEDCSVTNSVFRFLVINVAADNAVEITPTDDEA
jgi:hypothetical protein